MPEWKDEITRRLAPLKLAPAREAEIAEELAQHLDDRYRELVAGGTTEDEARRVAVEELEDEDLLVRGLRRVEQEAPQEPILLGRGSGHNFLASLWQDIRYSLRQLRRNPGFTIVAILTLSLGIGATTAIFSVVSGILLRPLPYPEPERLVSVMEAGPGIGNPASYPNFFDWQAQSGVFSSMASYHGAEFTLTGAGQPVRVQAQTVSSGLFQVLQAKPMLGRGLQPQDDQRGGDVVVLSHALWRDRFHAERSVVGKDITLDNKSFTVIGVMSAGFQFPPTMHEDLWTSVAVDRESGSNIMTGRGYLILSVIARLKPGVTLTKARTGMDFIAGRLAQEYPQTNARQTTVAIVPEIDRAVGSVRLPLLIILGVVAGVLLIASVNVANLSLARNLARQKEIALRAALGAPRARVARQLLTESLLLSFVGGAAGIVLAAWGTEGLVRLAPENLPRMQDVGMDWRVLAFAVVLSFVTGVLFGSMPALQASKISLVESLKEAGRTASRAIFHRRLRGTLVVAETAITLVLLAGAGLLISSYIRLVHVDPGFNPNGLLTFDLDLPTPPYTLTGSLNFMNRLLPRLGALPGVRSAAADWALPFLGKNPAAGVDFEGRTFPPGHTPVALVDAVSPDFFQAMGIALLRGRTFTDQDGSRSTPVVIVNEAFVHRYFPNEDALGKRIRPGISMTSASPWRQIVGVVGDTKQADLVENSQPEYYVPFSQFPAVNVVILRANSNPLGMVPGVRTVIASMDKSVPVYNVETMDDYLSASVARKRFSTLLLGFFGALALVLAAVGIYGVISFSVSQATHEIGIRMALGAQKTDVLKMVVGQGLRLTLIGVVIGIAGAFALTRFLSSLLYAVKPTDPLTFISVSLILIGVAMLACYIPARRATKVDPMVALRYE